MLCFSEIVSQVPGKLRFGKGWRRQEPWKSRSVGAWRPPFWGRGHLGTCSKSQCTDGRRGSGRADRQVELRLEVCRWGLIDAQGSGVLVAGSGRSMDSGWAEWK